jgi:chemotaxis protein CheD
MKTIMVGIGGIAVSNKPGEILKTMGLGSCVGILAVSVQKKVVGMAHIALSDSNMSLEKAKSLPGYFADTGVPMLLNEMKKLGINGHGDMIIKLAGGANVMDPCDLFCIGKRNVLSIRKYLWQNRLAPRIEDVGGSFCRTVWVEVDTGKVFLSSPGRGEWEI